MPSGGAREGAGRKRGSTTSKTREIAEGALKAGITPLEFMLNVMRGTACPEDAEPEVKRAWMEMQFEAAKAAAPYIHPRLTAIAVTPVQNAAIEGQLTQPIGLDVARRIAFALTLHADKKD